MPTAPKFYLSDLLTMPWAARTLVIVTLLALAFVYLMQYGFGLQPCQLCLWQRIPYGIALLAALAACFMKSCRHAETFFLGLCALCFATGLGLAIFHTGVERHWWHGLSSCTAAASSDASTMTTTDLRNQLLQTPVTPCDRIVWSFLGLSMTNYNILLSLLLLVFSALAAKIHFKAAKAGKA